MPPPDAEVRLLIVEREVAELKAEKAIMEAFRAQITLKIAEYDKERGLASKLLWPIVVALVTGFVTWTVIVLLQLFASK